MLDLKRTGPNSSELTTHDGTRILFSYGEPVAAILPHGRRAIRRDGYVSRTTERHIAEFLPVGHEWDAVTVDTLRLIAREAR